MRVGNLTLVSLLAVMAAGLPLAAAEHPVALPKNADTAQCISCHDEKTKGKAVHSAIAMGCTTCHEVKTQGETTNINLTAPQEELCFTCHDKSKEEFKHGPYEKGQCVSCHDPHSSDFPKQTRAEGNTLCLECHLERRTTDRTVTLFKSQTVSDSDFQAIPKIGLDPTLKRGHPMGMHPVADAPDLLHPGEKISCVTCHSPHASSREKLVPMVETKDKKPTDVCDACHLARDNAAMKAAQDAFEKQQQQPGQQPQKPQSKDKKSSKTGANKS